MCLNPGETSAEIDQRRMTCPACGCEQENAQECIRCGIVIGKYIEENSANMHIVPATNDITQRLKDIRKGHVVRFNGYLVRVDAWDKWHWQSSLTRKDTGNGAREVVWVEQLDII